MKNALRLTLAASLLGCSAAPSPEAQVEALVATEEATLVSPDASNYDDFGYGVSLSADGTRAAVGAIYDGHYEGAFGGYDAGSVRIYARSGLSWVEEATLIAPDAGDEDQFGHAVSMSADGTRVLIGASGDIVGPDRTGSARVFVRSVAGVWSQEAALLPVGANEASRVGACVSLSADGEHALVGAYWSDPPSGVNAGSVRAYVRSGSTWTFEQLLYAPGGAPNEWFGFSVSVSANGSRAIIGIPYGNRAQEWTRSVGGVWSESLPLLVPGIVMSDEFGRSVALSSDGNYAIVGARYRSPSEAGAAFAFRRTASAWTLEATLVPAASSPFSHFGTSAAINSNGTRSVIGAPDATVLGAAAAGRASVFSRVGTTWTEAPGLVASGTPEPNDVFGFSASISGDGSRALIGMKGDNTFTGSGRVFTLLGSNGDACTTASECASGSCVDGNCCNTICGGGVIDCQACSVSAGGTTNGTCGALATPSAVVCRGSAGACDTAETCIATSTGCPADALRPASFECRASAGECDVAELCSGAGNSCPGDGFAGASTVCGPAASGICDLADHCAGGSATCIATFSTGVCRGSTAACDPAESCSGSTTSCPSDVTTCVAPDAYIVPDAYTFPDAYMVPDAYVLPDAYVVPDAFVVPDAYVVPDAFVAPDAYTAPDAFTPPDAFTLPDAFVAPDAFVELDAGVDSDADMADAFAELDAGTNDAAVDEDAAIALDSAVMRDAGVADAGDSGPRDVGGLDGAVAQADAGAPTPTPSCGCQVPASSGRSHAWLLLMGALGLLLRTRAKTRARSV